MLGFTKQRDWNRVADWGNKLISRFSSLKPSFNLRLRKTIIIWNCTVVFVFVSPPSSSCRSVLCARSPYSCCFRDCTMPRSGSNMVAISSRLSNRSSPSLTQSRWTSNVWSGKEISLCRWRSVTDLNNWNVTCIWHCLSFYSYLVDFFELVSCMLNISKHGFFHCTLQQARWLNYAICGMSCAIPDLMSCYVICYGTSHAWFDKFFDVSSLSIFIGWLKNYL